MGSAARLLYPPMVILAAPLLSRRWPRPMWRASRCLAAVNGLALMCVMATGWLHRAGPVAEIHRWLPHGLLILDWSAIPVAIGVAAARLGSHPIGAAARVIAFLILGGLLLLASFTGYLGPSHGASDVTFRRFQLLHYWVLPTLEIPPVAWWHRSPTAADPAIGCEIPDL